MSYSQPRDRLELRLKEIVDNAICDATDRRTRFDALLAAVVDPSTAPPEQRDRIELYLSELAGRAGGGGEINLRTFSTVLGEDDISGTYNSGTGNAWNRIEISRDNDILKADSIRSGRTILGVTGTYAGETVNLQNGSLTLGAAALSSPLVPGAGYDGFSSVAVSLDSSVIKPENVKKDVTILGVTGTYDAGGILRYDSRQLACTGSHTVNLGWRPEHIIVSYVYNDPGDPDDPDHDEELVNIHLDLNQTTDITGEDDYVTFTSTGYSFVSVGTSFNDYPEDYSKLTFTAMAVT